MRLWWWWLLAVAATFGILEIASLLLDHGTDWTLSDCIRRWAALHHWLPMTVWGAAVALLVHWFVPPA